MGKSLNNENESNGRPAVQSMVSFNMKISASDKAEFTRICEELGIPPVIVVRSMIKKFIAAGGFPYEVRVDPRPAVNWDSPLILKARDENGRLVMPKEWRDEDDRADGDDY